MMMKQPAKQILLVENSKTARMSLSSKLSNMDFQLHFVNSGKEAVQIVQDHPYDLIIMDLFMPELNGYEAAKQIRALSSDNAQTPIFAYTTSQNPFDKIRCDEAGINEFILKSPDHQSLVDKMVAHFKNI